MNKKILVTGGAGFIGSTFVRASCAKGHKISVVDNLTYAGDRRRLGECLKKCSFHKADICDRPGLEAILKKERPQLIVNFAAESHVDRSIKDPGAFINTNFKGVANLLDLCLIYKPEKFLHVSTDEVYGDIIEGKFTEESPINPSSPYSATKAAADMLVKSYMRTYSFPALIIRPCNNYGPWQYPEKLIPLSVLKLLRGERIPVYGKGTNVREWLFVEDCVSAILAALEKGEPGDIFNIGSGHEMPNIEVVKLILAIMGKGRDMMEYVPDRPGHDLRYSLESAKFRRKTGWDTSLSFEQGLEKTIIWCLANKDWLLEKWGKISGLYIKPGKGKKTGKK